jgi:toxin YoeB
MYRLIFTDTAKAHYQFLLKSGNKKVIDKINRLLADIALHPYSGIGKPEALRFSLAGKWSRRITREHRIIYSVHDDLVIIYILALHSHYQM